MFMPQKLKKKEKKQKNQFQHRRALQRGSIWIRKVTAFHVAQGLKENAKAVRYSAVLNAQKSSMVKKFVVKNVKDLLQGVVDVEIFWD